MAQPSGSVYSSLEQVRVPAGVQPGQPFTVQVYATRKGQRVPKPRRLWRASGMMPCIVGRRVRVASGSRHASRPSAVARSSTGDRRAQPIDNITTVSADVAEWQTSEEMPFEANEADVGWLPGPVNGSRGRPVPAFTGPKPGPSNPRLTSGSSARTLLHEVQLTKEYKEFIVSAARQHAGWWARTHPVPCGVERAFSADLLTGDHVELYLAIRIAFARINPAVPAKSIWDIDGGVFNRHVALACTYMQYLWLERHLSFGEYGDTEAADSTQAAGGSDAAAVTGATTDPFRKRRAGSEIARAQAPKAYHPHQHIGYDDFVRPTRHRDGRRVRYKASVHTGKINHALNCARSKYFLHWEEDGWHREAMDAGTGGGGPGDANSAAGSGNGADRAAQGAEGRGRGRGSR